MILGWALTILSATFYVIGIYFIVASFVGFIRYKDFYMRAQAVILSNVYGLSFVMLAESFITAQLSVFAQALALVLLNIFATLTAVHILSRFAMATKIPTIAISRRQLNAQKEKKELESVIPELKEKINMPPPQPNIPPPLPQGIPSPGGQQSPPPPVTRGPDGRVQRELFSKGISKPIIGDTPTVPPILGLPGAPSMPPSLTRKIISPQGAHVRQSTPLNIPEALKDKPSSASKSPPKLPPLPTPNRPTTPAPDRDRVILPPLPTSLSKGSLPGKITGDIGHISQNPLQGYMDDIAMDYDFGNDKFMRESLGKIGVRDDFEHDDKVSDYHEDGDYPLADEHPMDESKNDKIDAAPAPSNFSKSDIDKLLSELGSSIRKSNETSSPPPYELPAQEEEDKS